MSNDGVDLNRRHFLTVATSVAGAVGAVAAAVPFVSSMQPSARAKALGAPVEVDISKIEAGAMASFTWRGKPVVVVNRTSGMLKSLDEHNGMLRDPMSKEDQQPNYCENKYRSIKPEYLVMVNICTHLGCSPTYRPETGAKDLGEDWPGGFFCPCHGSKYDLSGRVFKDVPAPLNMVIPPYHYEGDRTLKIGEDKKGAA